MKKIRREYIVKSQNTNKEEHSRNTFTDEEAAKNFIDSMVGCCYDNGGYIEIEVIVEDKIRTIGTTRLAIEIKKHFAIYDATGEPWRVETYMDLAEFVLQHEEK